MAEKNISQAKLRQEIKKSQKNSIKDAASVNATVGFGDNYISAYAREMKASVYELGLLTSIPNLIAPFAQLFTWKLMKKYPRKKIYSLAIFFQSLFWLPLIAISFLFLKNISYAPLLVIIFYTIYAIFGHLASPAWVSWIGDLVSSKETGKFFGKRNRVGGIVALVSIFTAGLVLDLFKSFSGNERSYMIFIGFMIIFFSAMIFRFISRSYVLKQYEPEFKAEDNSYFSFFQFVKKIPHSNYGKFATYIALIVFAANIAGSYYIVYMFDNLKFSYSFYMIAIVSSSLSSFIFMSSWGRFSDKYGEIKTLRITGILIALTPLLWPLTLFMDLTWAFIFVIIINLLSGFAWAGFNLSSGNFVYQAATPQRRGLCSAYASVLNGFGVFFGASLGSFIISTLGISFMNPVMFVAIVSGLLLLVFYFLIFLRVKEVREVKKNIEVKMIPLASEIYNMNNSVKNGIYKLLKNGNK